MKVKVCRFVDDDGIKFTALEKAMTKLSSTYNPPSPITFCVAVPWKLKEVWFGLPLCLLLHMLSSSLALILMFVMSCLRTLRKLYPTKEADAAYTIWTTSLHGCLNWYWNKAWKCIAGQGQNCGHLDLGVLSCSKVQLEGLIPPFLHVGTGSLLYYLGSAD